jgi:predicted HD phosphohydrolase
MALDTTVIATVQEILGACRSMSGLPYDGEPVDQLEHALQAAALARESDHERDFVIACLLHDIARSPVVAGIPYDGPSEHHGATAARWLAPRSARESRGSPISTSPPSDIWWLPTPNITRS